MKSLLFFQTWDRGWPACGPLGRQTSARTKTSGSSINNVRGHDISQGLDREPPSLSPHFLLPCSCIYQRLKHSRAKFVCFVTFIQTWNNHLFIFCRESRSLSLRRNVVILSSDRCVFTWPTLIVLLKRDIPFEPIKIQLNTSECFLSPSARSFESGATDTLFWTHFSWPWT